MDDSIAFLNGAWVPLSETKISVLDRGFIFGDGIYEMIPVYGRRAFLAELHFDRLKRSLTKVGMKNPYDRTQWLTLLDEAVTRNTPEDQGIYIQVTRGVAPRNHPFPDAAPTVFIMSQPIVPYPGSVREQGIACITMEDMRWLHCDIKSTSLMGSVLAAQHAAQNGALETIQFRYGYLTEGASSNVWVMRDGILYGAHCDNRILEGIRYHLIRDFCARTGIPFVLRGIERVEVCEADEVFISSALREVLPVTTIDGRPVGSGLPGPVYRALYNDYRAQIAQLKQRS